jgi:glycosyltransferase involved in cell wall biosynthesis
VLRLHEALARRGWEVAMALPDSPGTGAERLRDGGVETLQLPLGRLRADPRLLPRYVRQFRPTVRAIEEAIERTGADVVVILGLVNPHAAIAARRRGVPVVWHVIDAMTPTPLRQLAMRLVRRYADVVIFAAEPLVERHGQVAVPTFIGPPPVDTAVFVPSPERRQRIRSELGIPLDAPVVGTVSPLLPVKGLEVFLAAAERIAAARPETRFVVVGGTSESHRAYAERLRRRAAELSLPHPVHFAGERADVERWYPAFDVHVNTSHSESTTTTAMEAHACGVPVVSTRVGAVGDVVIDGVTGLLVEPGDAEQVADAVLRLLGDEELRARFGAAGRESVVARFGIEAAADVQAAALEAALAR